MAVHPIFVAKAQHDARFHLQVEIIHRSRAQDADFGARGHGNFEVMASTKRIFRGDQTLSLGDEIKFGVYISEEDLYGAGVSFHPRDFDSAHYIEVFLNGEPPYCAVPIGEHYLIEELTAVPTVNIQTELLPVAERLRESGPIWTARAGEPFKRFPQKPVDIDDLQDKDGIFYLINESSPYTGKVTGWHENGQRKSEVDFVDGKRHGKGTSWRENGQKKSEVDFVDGKSIGKTIEWYENGQKESEADFVDENSTGKIIDWYENGQKKSEVDFVDGKLHGKFIEWYENGQRKLESNYVQGKLNGKAARWHNDGRIFRRLISWMMK